MNYEKTITTLNNLLDTLFEDRVKASINNDYFKEIEIVRQISNVKNLINYIQRNYWQNLSLIIYYCMKGGFTHIDKKQKIKIVTRKHYKTIIMQII